MQAPILLNAKAKYATPFNFLPRLKLLIFNVAAWFIYGKAALPTHLQLPVRLTSRETDLLGFGTFFLCPKKTANTGFVNWNRLKTSRELYKGSRY